MKPIQREAREPLSKDTVFTLCLMGVTAVAVIGTGIYYGQAFVRLLPLCISLFIAFLQTRANRYAPLLIGFNALLYGYSYFHYHLYANMAFAILISCPLQLITFYNWRRKPYKQSTVFRRMTSKQRLLWGGVALAVWAVASLLFYRFQSDFNLLDTTVTILGIFTTVLSLLSYMEFPFLSAMTQFCAILLYLTMLKAHPEQITYTVYSVYAFICAVKAFIRVRRLYREQQELTASADS